MAIVGKPKTQKQFVKFMRSHKMHKPGHHITVHAMDIFLNNVLPVDPDCKDCNDQVLARLTYLCKFRDDHLNKGVYVGKNGGVIRAYAAVYNEHWMLNYAKKAYNAANRGHNLNNSTPLAHMQNKVVNDKHFKVAKKALSKIK